MIEQFSDNFAPLFVLRFIAPGFLKNLDYL